MNEVGIYYTGSYLCLGSFFMRPGVSIEEKPGPVVMTQRFEILPNPGLKSVKIIYALSREEVVSLTIFDLTGRRVLTLCHGMERPGRHEVRWTPGEDVASGIFFIKFASGKYSQTEKLVLLR